MSIRYKADLRNENIYFITFTILDWKNIFTEKKYIDLVYKWFGYTRTEYNNKLYGYVIMPNHIHCITELSGKSPKLSTLIQNAKRFLVYDIVKFLKEDKKDGLLNYFSKKANIKKNAKHKIFDDRYDSQIVESRKFFLQKLNYIHNNPCQKKWGLATQPEEYPYSSASNYVLEKGLYAVDTMEF